MEYVIIAEEYHLAFNKNITCSLSYLLQKKIVVYTMLHIYIMINYCFDHAFFFII
jgi:hypothetical protein